MVRVRVSVRRRRAATENLILVVGPFSFRGEPGRDISIFLLLVVLSLTSQVSGL